MDLSEFYTRRFSNLVVVFFVLSVIQLNTARADREQVTSVRAIREKVAIIRAMQIEFDALVAQNRVSTDAGTRQIVAQGRKIAHEYEELDRKLKLFKNAGGKLSKLGIAGVGAATLIGGSDVRAAAVRGVATDGTGAPLPVTLDRSNVGGSVPSASGSIFDMKASRAAPTSR